MNRMIYDDGACGVCDGTGHATLMDTKFRHCLYCRGSGKGADIIWFSVVAFLEILGVE